MTSFSAPDALAALQLAYDRLQQQHQTLAAFLGMASHELRAPINQVISLHQLILENLCESPEEEREFIGQANQAIIRMLHNLDTLISLSKLDIGAISPVCEPVFLGTVLNKVRQFTEMQCINRQCRLVVNPGPEASWVLSDDRWLLQALLSLVESALAAGSTAITLEGPNGSDSVHQGLSSRALGKPFGNLADHPSCITLQFTCNAQPWPPDIPASLAAPSSNGNPAISLEPSFGYGLAHRILAHLGHDLCPVSSPAAEGHTLLLILPKARVNPRE
ncbi:MAG: hypothetical protein RLZZ597_3429 [Cyanobacteriota bacterium]|jgi:hypothetical protein